LYGWEQTANYLLLRPKFEHRNRKDEDFVLGCMKEEEERKWESTNTKCGELKNETNLAASDIW
jgi:hypothetical protein